MDRVALRTIVANLTDAELNARIAVIDNYDENWVARHPHLVKDYCNDHGAGGPLISQFGIGTQQHYTNDDWTATPRLHDEAEAAQAAGSMLRAAMQSIVLLDAIRQARQNAPSEKPAKVVTTRLRRN